MSSSSSQSSKLLFPASKKAKETETISKNNKNPEINSLLEAAALANDVSGTGNQFCFSYFNKFESMKNESAKIKNSMKFVSQYVSEAEMNVLKSGNPGADAEKMQSLKKTCADIKKKVVEELMKQVRKDKPGPKETFTAISIDSKLKQQKKTGEGVGAVSKNNWVFLGNIIIKKGLTIIYFIPLLRNYIYFYLIRPLLVSEPGGTIWAGTQIVGIFASHWGGSFRSAEELKNRFPKQTQ